MGAEPGPGAGAPGRGTGGVGRTERIEIRGVRVVGTHGVLDEERRRAQPFELDVDVWLDQRPAAASDSLADTVDYGALVDRAVAVVAGGRAFRLLEALAGSVADELLAADDRIDAVAVTVRKLRPPLPADVASVGVRALRRRSG